jgi:hypothetical protein
MKKLLFLLMIGPALFAQDLTLSATGFEPVSFPRPALTDDKIVEAVKGWADSYNKREHDVFNVTQHSLEVDAMKDNAFYYHNLGELYSYNIKYNLKISFDDKRVWVAFGVKEIYTKRTLLKTAVADFFGPDGNLKEDFSEVKPSLEKTAGKIVRSLAKYLRDYQ